MESSLKDDSGVLSSNSETVSSQDSAAIKEFKDSVVWTWDLPASQATNERLMDKALEITSKFTGLVITIRKKNNS